MTARTLQQLLAEETPERLRAALADLDALEARTDIKADPKWIAETRAEFEAELRTLESQGSLF